jgi:hypothetical protein
MNGDQLLTKLHEALSKELLKRIEEGTAKPQDLAVAAKFLKDNGIDALPVSGSPMADLVKAMGDELFKGPDDVLN